MTWKVCIIRGAIVFGVAGLIAACSSSAPPPQLEGAEGGVAVPADPSGGGVVPPGEGISGYRLGSGDRVRVTTFRQEEVSGEFELDGEGFFSMPLLGEILAKGMTARQLENEIELRLKNEGYFVNPQVSVEILNYRPFYIIGEVNNPGSYAFVNGMTVINAVALAGGFTYRADQDDIVLTRGGANGERREVAIHAEVLPGDILEVPERFF